MTEQVRDVGVGEKEVLRAPQTSEASVLPLAVSSGPVALLDQVVLSLGRRNLDVLHCCQLGHLLYGCAVTPEPVADGLLGNVLLVEQPHQETLGRFFAARLLQQHVQHLAVLVDRPPQPVDDPAENDAHLVQMPNPATLRLTVPHRLGQVGSELGTLGADHLVADVNASLEKQLLHVPARDRQAVVEVDGVRDDRLRIAGSPSDTRTQGSPQQLT